VSTRNEERRSGTHARTRRPRLTLAGLAVGEARVAQPGTDGQCAPVLHLAHERHLAQTPPHGVVVHQHRRVMPANFRNRFGEPSRQVEGAALPVPRQVLRALCDVTVLLDLSGAADADEWGEVVAFLLGT